MTKSNVAILIVTYNGMQWLDSCLQSCEGYTVIVVDNASTDSTVKFLKGNFPDVEILTQSKNLGFGAANNIGIRYALDKGAEQIFLLNQDAYLVGNVLEELSLYQNENPEYGILSPIHIKADKSRLDGNFLNYMLKAESNQFYSDFVLGNDLKPVYDVPFVNAAAWLVSKKCFETVGGFDPLFFHYGEDNNYCQRVLYHGFKIGVLPKVYVIHDRIDRNQLNVVLFSDEYYRLKELNYKIKYADISKQNLINDKISRLKKKILKSQVKLNFSNTKGLKRELEMLYNLKLGIEHSRQTNIVSGPNYLFSKE